MKQKASAIWKRVRYQTCSLSLPISNRDPCMLESLS